jgi:hypothetical protein
VMSEDDYQSEESTETSAISPRICSSFMDSIIDQDSERMEQYPKVVLNRRVIARVQIE